jgi:integrase
MIVAHQEGEVGQDLQPRVPDRWMQSQAGFPRLPEGGGGAREARPRRLLAAQVPRDVRYPVSLGGVDLRTVQPWLGHSDMESTMRYLKPSRSQHARDKVNEIFA